jgi:hypothetical protein
MSALHAASSASKIKENDARLLSIWSAFEALLPIPMKDGESITRITHFVEYLSPLISARYTENIFRCFYNDLNKEYRNQLRNFIKAYGSGRNNFDKFIGLFFAEQSVTRAFTAIFSDSELMLYRAHELFTLANDPSALLRRIEAHETRVGWQLHRIYRMRNMFVHSAARTPFASQLTENALEYFKALISSLVEVGEMTMIVESDALIDVCIAMCEEHREKLRGLKDDSGRKFLECAVKGPFK